MANQSEIRHVGTVSIFAGEDLNCNVQGHLRSFGALVNFRKVRFKALLLLLLFSFKQTFICVPVIVKKLFRGM